MLDNMLIVTPPEEKEQISDAQVSAKQNNVLDFNDLDVDYLAEDFLGGDDLTFYRARYKLPRC